MASQVNSEDQLQAEIFQWHWNNFPDDRRMLFHVQQKARNAIEGARFKAIGVVAGVSDLIHIGKQIIFIELKWQQGNQRIKQVQFMAQVKARGYLYLVIRDADTAKKVIQANIVVLQHG